MSTTKPIRSALISAFHKEPLKPVLEELKKLYITIYSTGGTQTFIEQQGLDVTAVEELTSYPSILGGRVKTLHPKVFGGILARSGEDEDAQQLQEYGIPEIDLVIVDLYPFEKTLQEDASESEIIEKIDIGGIALIRAAAKNFRDTMVVSSQEQYASLATLLAEQEGSTTLEDRQLAAARAFETSARYDALIKNYLLNDNEPSAFTRSYAPARQLRYGENPHQRGVFYGKLDDLFTQLNGKELSYNNLVDIDGAINIIREFDNTAFAILKHTNPCGVAVRDTVKQAYQDALAGDPVSAFGGILITNGEVDQDAAEEMHDLFFEVLLAPSFSEEALALLSKKKNRILLQLHNTHPQPTKFKSLLNGVIEQDTDTLTESADDLQTVTDQAPTDQQVKDLLFANRVVKHLKSNTIALVKDQQLIGMGCGQTSRIDALKQSVHKAYHFGFATEGAVLASDAFFPFSDSVEEADQAGIKAVIQPGGSKRDQDSIDYCNNHNMAMAFTGTRHFLH
jgi:phosphoribosylaminoimidazolecarboxamide formyltransferase/IMP cyclohydrolase